ncbi:MAG: hypothetical protein LBB65_08875 [Burkholderiales bacterium]|jgi:hypothetical protein|nr:hypothetical protein [Burkholderiales bacterium]
MKPLVNTRFYYERSFDHRHAAFAAPDRDDPGLPQLLSLYLNEIDQLDLAPIVARHPDLRELRLFGKPGTLTNLSDLAHLSGLRVLLIEDLFAFAPADFPSPGTHPHLAMLCLESIPADIAATVKKLYAPLKKSALIDLDIRKPRAPEWLAENLDNPFREWDGSEFVTPTNARKAAALYKKTRSALRAQLAAPKAAETLPAWLEQVVRDWAAEINDPAPRARGIRKCH